MLKVMCGERAISIDRAVRLLEVCGVSPHSAIMLTLAGEEAVACEWMHREMGAFLDESITSLPGQLDSTLGRRVDDLMPRCLLTAPRSWSPNYSRHSDDLANRDIAMSLAR